MQLHPGVWFTLLSHLHCTRASHQSLPYGTYHVCTVKRVGWFTVHILRLRHCIRSLCVCGVGYTPRILSCWCIPGLEGIAPPDYFTLSYSLVGTYQFYWGNTGASFSLHKWEGWLNNLAIWRSVWWDYNNNYPHTDPIHVHTCYGRLHL